MIFGIVSHVKLTSLKRDANTATNVDSDALRLVGSPVKSRRKVVEKDQLLCCWRSLYYWVVCFKITLRESLFFGKLEKLGSKHTVKFSEGTRHRVKIRERKGPSQGVMQKCEPHERKPCAPKFEERTQEETLQHERCARREAWKLAKSVHKLKNQSYVLLSYRRKGNAGTLFEKFQRNENSWSTLEHQCTC